MTDAPSARSIPGLDGRAALVTGAAGGIGRSVLAALTDGGAQAAGIDAGAGAGHLRADVTDAAAITAAVDEAARELGSLELLVCAAGVVSEAPLEELDPAEWRRVVEVSLTGTFLTLRAAIPHLRRAGGGSVVALSSGWARRPYPLGAHYAAAKAGVEALVRSAAAELGPAGIRVNAVAPGPVRTPMLDDLPAFDEQQRAATTPLGRIGEPEDVAGAIVFLLSDASRHVTGQVLGVNGGLVMA